MTEQQLATPEVTTSQNTEVTIDNKVSTNTEKNTSIDTQVSFKDTLSEELKQIKSLEKFKDVNDLAKSYTNLESLIGKKVNEMPEDILKQYLKVPTTPDKYAISDEAKEAVSQEILEIGLKANINQDQMKVLTDALALEVRKNKEQAEIQAKETLETNRKELEKEFGISLDKRMDAVKSVLSQYGNEDLNTALKESGLLHNAKFISFLDKITQDVLSVKMIGEDYTKSKALTPSEARNEVNRKMQDADFRSAYYSANHPAHKSAVEEMRKLFSSMNA